MKNITYNWNQFINFMFRNATTEEMSSFCDLLYINQNIKSLDYQRSIESFKAIYNIYRYLLTMGDVNFLSLSNFFNFFNLDFFEHNIKKNNKLISENEFLIQDKYNNINKESLIVLDKFYNFLNEYKSKYIVFKYTNFIDKINFLFNQIPSKDDTDLIFFCEQILEKYKYDNSNILFNLIKDLLFDDKTNISINNQIINNIEKNESNQFYSDKNLIFELIINNITNKKVLNYIQLYIDYYKKEFKINNKLLSQEDIVFLFFSDYFKTFNNHYPCLILLLINNFNQENFDFIINKYDIPINCPFYISQYDIINEKLDNKIHKKIIRKQYFYNILDYCFKYSLTNVANKIFKKYKHIILNDFFMEVERKNNDLNYSIKFEYSLWNKEEYEPKSDNFLKFLIKHKMIKKHEKINFQNVDNKVIFENFYFYLINYQKYDLFINITNKSNIENSEKLFDFLLQNIKLLISYNKTLNDYSDILKILSKSVNDKDKIFSTQNISILKYIYEHDFPALKHILELLNEFIPSKLFYSEQFSFNEKNINQKNITWFDLTELETKLEESMSTDSSNLKVLKKMSESEIMFKKTLHIDHNIFDELLIKFPNFKDVIDYYNSSFKLKKLNEYYHIMPILLLGEPGIGKTYFSQVFSEKINTGFTFIDLASMTSKWILSGSNRTWKEPRQGKILDAMSNSSTISPVIVLDEIDKNQQSEHNPLVVLYQLLEPANAKYFYDEFADLHFNASNIIYICCANSLNNLTEPLISRLKIFNIKSPNKDQLINIINNIYNDIIKDLGIFENNLDSDLVKNFLNFSIREIKNMLQFAINQSISKYNTEELLQMKIKNLKIKITQKDLDLSIKKQNMGFI